MTTGAHKHVATYTNNNAVGELLIGHDSQDEGVCGWYMYSVDGSAIVVTTVVLFSSIDLMIASFPCSSPALCPNKMLGMILGMRLPSCGYG